MNERKQSTERLCKALKDKEWAEYVSNTLEQHNFDNLVRRGIIVRGEND